MPDQLYCRFCGQGMPSDSQFCPHCGKSQYEPAPPGIREVSPAEPSLSAQQPSTPIPTVTGEKKARKIPVVAWVIIGLVSLCCIGVVITAIASASFREVIFTELNVLSQSSTQSAARETYFPEATLGPEQADLTRKWTPPFMALMVVEHQAQEFIETVEAVEAGTLTMEEFEVAYAANPYIMVDMLFFSFDEYKDYLTKETKAEWIVDPAVQPFIAGLEDDYIKLTETTLEWWSKIITPAEAIEKYKVTQDALAIEREKMHQAAIMDGMSEEVYLGVQSMLEDQWPGLKAQWSDAARKMLTPQP